MMNRLLVFLFTLLVMGCGISCASDEPVNDVEVGNTSYFFGKKF